RLPPDESLVALNRAVQPPAVLSLKGQPEPRQHEPRGLLSDTKGAGEFVAADAVLAVSEQPQRRQPLLKAQRRVFEDGADLERELRARMLRVALEPLLSGEV